MTDPDQLIGALQKLETARAKMAAFNRPRELAQLDAAIADARSNIAQNLNQIRLMEVPKFNAESAVEVDLSKERQAIDTVRTKLEMALNPSLGDPIQQDMESQDWVHYGIYPQDEPKPDLFKPEDEAAFRDWALHSSINVDLATLSNSSVNDVAPPVDPQNPPRGMDVWGQQPNAGNQGQAPNQGPPSAPQPNADSQNKDNQPRNYDHMESWLNESFGHS